MVAVDNLRLSKEKSSTILAAQDCSGCVHWFSIATLLLISGMKIAVEGCAHGELDAIYESLAEIERHKNIKIDLLLCCGDFQAVRNDNDLSCMNVKPKYRRKGDFHRQLYIVSE